MLTNKKNKKKKKNQYNNAVKITEEKGFEAGSQKVQTRDYISRHSYWQDFNEKEW